MQRTTENPVLFSAIKKFLVSEDGPTAVEYAVMLMLIILACITAIQFFGVTTANSFQNSSDQLSDAFGS
jgi:pilus assembly protein Flp/PilA